RTVRCRDGAAIGPEDRESRLRGAERATAPHAPQPQGGRGGDRMTIDVNDVRLHERSAPFSLSIERGSVTGLGGLERAGQAEFLLALCGLRRPASMTIEGLGPRIARRGV